MDLQSKSLLGQFYKFMFDDSLPENSCILIKNMFFAVILFPIAIIGSLPLWSEECWDYRSLFMKTLNGALVWVATIFFSVVGLAFVTKCGFEFWKDWPLFFVAILGLIGMAIFIIGVILAFAIIIGSIELCKYGINKYQKYSNSKRVDKLIDEEDYTPVEPSKLMIILNTIKDKTCIKINWK